MKKFIKKLKPQKRVEVKQQWEGPNPQGEYLYVEGPKKDAKTSGS